MYRVGSDIGTVCGFHMLVMLFVLDCVFVEVYVHLVLLCMLLTVEETLVD